MIINLILIIYKINRLYLILISWEMNIECIEYSYSKMLCFKYKTPLFYFFYKFVYTINSKLSISNNQCYK